MRRVTAKEREEVKERYKKERVLYSALSNILGEKAASVLQKIKESYDSDEFLTLARDKPEILEKFVPKDKIQAMQKVFVEKKEKEKEIKKIIVARTITESGINSIKNLLSLKNAQVRYLGSSNFSISVKDNNFKKANIHMEALLKELKDKAKHLKVDLEIK